MCVRFSLESVVTPLRARQERFCGWFVELASVTAVAKERRPPQRGGS